MNEDSVMESFKKYSNGIFSFYKGIMLPSQVLKVVLQKKEIIRSSESDRFCACKSSMFSANHIVFLPWYKANNSRGLLSRFLQGGKWRCDAEWADREREVTTKLIVSIIYFYWARGLWDLSIHTPSENPIWWSLSILLRWKHRAPSHLPPRLTCTWKAEKRLEQERRFWFSPRLLLAVPPSATRENMSKTDRVLHLQDVLKVFFFPFKESHYQNDNELTSPSFEESRHIPFISLVITAKDIFNQSSSHWTSSQNHPIMAVISSSRTSAFDNCS